jgi:SAM-dependent methyltransferase
MTNGAICPVCGSTKTEIFLRRDGVPVHQNVLYKDRNAAVSAKRGNLRLSVCRHCGFVFNQAFDASKLDYGNAYDNTQTASPFFEKYLDELARYLIQERDLRNCRLLEIGCGKGEFLRKLVVDAAWANTGVGFDPSYVGPTDDLGGRLKFEKRFYDENAGMDDPADVVICRHVLEHVPDPVGLLVTARKAMKGSVRGRAFIETPCVEWILSNGVFWDFFFEHCSYFSKVSLGWAAKFAGLKVLNVKHIFGGQYLWLETGRSNGFHRPSGDAAGIGDLAQSYAQSEGRSIDEWKQKIDSWRKKGPVALWGAGAKGVTLANLVDPECERIACLVDLNPNKQGCFVSGTGHPIVNYLELQRLSVKAVYLMNPNYREENVSLLRQAGLDIELIG